MTILARTSEHLVEFEDGYFTIARYADGYCKGLKRKGIAGEFRETTKDYGAKRAIDVYLRLMKRFEWEPLYKPHCMPGADSAWDEATGVADELQKLGVAA